MQNDVLSEIAFAMLRGDSSLWLGPDWTGAISQDDATCIFGVDWLGIWTEARSLAPHDVTRPTQTSSGRLIVEVPGRIGDVLGVHFSFADVCPYFYLRGRDVDAEPLTERQRRRTRDEMVEQLGRLGATVLIISGYHNRQTLHDTLQGDIAEVAPDCRMIIVCGVAPDIGEEVVKEATHALVTPVIYAPLSLPVLLSTLQARRRAIPDKPSIRVGRTSIDIDRFLRSEPPVDQEFIVVTEQSVREPDRDESERHLLVDLLRGAEPPWRAMAHNLAWDRGLPHRAEVRAQLQRLSQGPAQVVCLNIPSEPGAGLTVLLQQIAFDTARAHCPTLLHRGEAGAFDYNLLRTFLTDLYVHIDEEQKVGSAFPTVLIFDATSTEADAQGMLQTVPARLARDGRRALVIRGIPLKCADELTSEFKRFHSIRARGGPVNERWLPPLAASLDQSQQNSLLHWATTRFERIGERLHTESIDLIHNWDKQQADAPLLTCLYLILRGELRDAAALGRHLVERLRKGLEPDKSVPDGQPSAGDAPLHGPALQDAVARLNAHFRTFSHEDDPVSAEDASAIFVVLAALACLRIAVPRRVLADIAGVEHDRIHRLIAFLEGRDLVSTNLPSTVGGTAPRPDRRLAASAFYTMDESIGLRHPVFGRMIVDWLRGDIAASDFQFLDARRFASAIVQAMPPREPLDEFPIAVLEPVFRRLTPARVHVEFADDIAARYLRLQKGRHHESLSRWQWRNANFLRRAFGWLPEQLIKQSASLLHSRGITTYKTCGVDLPLDQCRGRYQDAEADFLRAIDLAKLGGSERPVTILTSLGLLYLGWLDKERSAGNETEWRELDRKVETTLRGALAEYSEENPFAVFGLARYLVSRYRRALEAPRADKCDIQTAAQDLAEAIELLQGEPEPYFEDDWNGLWTEAVSLLGEADARRVIATLKANGDELGYALDALRTMGGRIPTGPTKERGEVQELVQATAILQLSAESRITKRCNLAQLLRYAVFSAEPARLKDPAFQARYELLAPLLGSRYLDVPMWMFDYAMLSFQVGKYSEGADMFARLRKGQRFFEVSRDRGCALSQVENPLVARKVFLRVVSIDSSQGKGWGRVEHPIRFRDPVPFSVRSFSSRGKRVSVGASVTCFVRLNPAGPYAEPQ
jgi:hypothetical protein